MVASEKFYIYLNTKDPFYITRKCVRRPLSYEISYSVFYFGLLFHLKLLVTEGPDLYSKIYGDYYLQLIEILLYLYVLSKGFLLRTSNLYIIIINRQLYSKIFVNL